MFWLSLQHLGVSCVHDFERSKLYEEENKFEPKKKGLLMDGWVSEFVTHP
jgi:hypothetical protein